MNYKIITFIKCMCVLIRRRNNILDTSTYKYYVLILVPKLFYINCPWIVCYRFFFLFSCVTFLRSQLINSSQCYTHSYMMLLNKRYKYKSNRAEKNSHLALSLLFLILCPIQNLILINKI